MGNSVTGTAPLTCIHLNDLISNHHSSLIMETVLLNEYLREQAIKLVPIKRKLRLWLVNEHFKWAIDDWLGGFQGYFELKELQRMLKVDFPSKPFLDNLLLVSFFPLDLPVRVFDPDLLAAFVRRLPPFEAFEGFFLSTRREDGERPLGPFISPSLLNDLNSFLHLYHPLIYICMYVCYL